MNTYLESQDNQSYSLTPAGANPVTDVMKTAIANYNYSLISQVAYVTPLLGGNAVFTGYFRHKKLNTHNQINESSAKIYDNYGMAGVTYSRRIKKLVIDATLAGSAISHKSNGATLNYFYFTPLVDIAYVSNHMSVRLTSQIKTDNPTIGMLSENASIIDDNYFSVGNPELKPSHSYVNELRLEFMSKNQKFYITPSVTYIHTRDPYVPILSNATLADSHREVVVNRIENIDHVNNLSFDISFTYSPASWLRISPSYGMSHTSYRVPRGKVNHTSHMPGMYLQLSYKAFESSMAYNCPILTKRGDTSWREGSQNNFRIMWKHKSFSVGLTYHYQRSYMSRAWSDNFSYCKRVTLDTPRKNVELTFTYRFTNNKSYRHSRKDLYNADYDAGKIKRDSN